MRWSRRRCPPCSARSSWPCSTSAVESPRIAHTRPSPTTHSRCCPTRLSTSSSARSKPLPAIRGSPPPPSLFRANGGAITRVDRDATAFFHRDALFFIRYTSFWDASAGAATESANLSWVRGVYDSMRPHVSRGAVANYVDPDLEDWGSAYYGS